MKTYYLQVGEFYRHDGVFFSSRARTARGLWRAAAKAAGISESAVLPYGSRICETETHGDITTAQGWAWVELDFENNCCRRLGIACMPNAN